MGLLGVCVAGMSRRVRHLGGGCCNLSRRCLDGNSGVRRVLSSTSGGSHGNNNSTEPWIPEYKPRSGEHVETKRSRLLYQSRKRGMLENGLVLSTFAARYLSNMSPEQLDLYDSLINRPSNDWDIYYWATGAVETPEEYSNEIMDMLKSFVRNADRESRLSQPDLYPI